MTYSVIVTICFIITFVLLLNYIAKGSSIQEQHQASVERLKREYTGNQLLNGQYKEAIVHHKRLAEKLRDELAEERQRVLTGQERLQTQRERLKFLREKNNALNDELMMVSDLMHVKFTAVLPDGQPVKTTFKLGLGPCGLHVKSLKWTELDDRYLIDQMCTNGERKQFTYYKSDVVGRIEFRYGTA